MTFSGSSKTRLAIAVPLTIAATSSLSVYLYYTGRLRFFSRYPYISCTLRKSFARDSRSHAPALGAPKGPLSIESTAYPWTQRDNDCVEERFGIDIADPYRWLEDPESPKTAAFVESQNILSSKIFEQCSSRENFKKLFTKLYNFPKYGCPRQEGKRFFFSYNSGLENQPSIHVHDGNFKTAKLFLDPNEWSDDGTIALTGTYFSKNAKYMAYSVSNGGSDWKKIKVLKLMEQGGYLELKDEIEFVKFSGASWTHDELGFFYCRFPDPKISDNGVLGRENNATRGHYLCYHVLGTNQSEDKVILQLDGRDEWVISSELTDDGNYVIINLHPGTKPGNAVSYLDLKRLSKLTNGALDFTEASSKIVELVKDTEGSYDYVANEESIMTFQTTKNAPRYKIVRVDFQDPTNWKDVIPQRQKDVLQWTCAVKGDNLITCYMKDVANELGLYSLETGEKKASIDIPQFGSITSFSGKRYLTDVFFIFQSRTLPPTIYKYNAEKRELEIEHSTEIPGLNPSEYETKQVFVESYDKEAKIPMFITYRKGMEKNGTNPTLLYGYGGFNVSLLPNFSITNIAFIMGYNGISASANIRGGGEYGIEWRDAGSLGNKQNVFDDFHVCSEYLIEEKYCDPAHLAIHGGSNGGLLVAACANQRPDLYSSVICEVGVLDMLRYHLFTFGKAWIPDFGNPDVLSDFEYLFKYSPLHNINVPGGESKLYPSILFTTADQDDRVSPLHTLKFLATLQHVFSSVPGIEETNPIIARIDTKAGHGAGKPTSMIIEERTDVISFIATVLRATWNTNALPE